MERLAEDGPRQSSQGSVPEEQASSRWDLLAVAAIVAGAVVRVIWGLVIHPPGDFIYSDMGGYVERARRLADEGPLLRSDALFPPGTHMLLAAPMEIFGTGTAGLWAGSVLWCVMSCLIPLFTWRLARLLLTPAAAALATAFCAFWPLYITYGGFFTSETPSLALMVIALWAGYRASRLSGWEAAGLGLFAGVIGGVAIACRPQWILNLAVLAVPLLIRFRRRALALAGIVIGATVILAAVVLHNSVAAGETTGLSENGGLNFWMGHCDVRAVTTVDTIQGGSYVFGNPVWGQLDRGGTYYFQGRSIWDQSFFYGMGLDCIRRDGVGHVRVLARGVLNMTATTVPWPQSNDENGQRGVVNASNVAYSLLLPWVLIESVFLIRRRRAAGQPPGELVMLAHFVCVVLVAWVFFGDPRLRSSYDVFGLALLAALVADRFGLDAVAPERKQSEHGD
ncbi:MAG: glycosyltransferase family 39 protein [Rubrobacteraceae bacterium]